MLKGGFLREVSIRSPHQSKGRPLDPDRPRLAITVSIRSPHQSKGRHAPKVVKQGLRSVSIRSPHQSKGRPNTASTFSEKVVFQSAPLTKARGDASGQLAKRGYGRFNPLPSPKQGETPSANSNPQCSASFNPLPSPKQGETASGTSTTSRSRACFNPLPSPKQGETRRGEEQELKLVGFNPLPSPKQGETARADFASIAVARFNPLPSPKQGETLVAVTSGTTKGYISGCANLLSSASYCRSESLCLAVNYC